MFHLHEKSREISDTVADSTINIIGEPDTVKHLT